MSQVIATFDCTLQQVFGMAEGLLALPGWTIRMPPFSQRGRPLSPGRNPHRRSDENDVAPGEPGIVNARPHTISAITVPAQRQAFTAQGFHRRRRCQAGSSGCMVEGRIRGIDRAEKK